MKKILKVSILEITSKTSIMISNTLEFSVNMTCGKCERRVGEELNNHDIGEYSIDLDNQKVVVITATKTADEVKEAIEKTGKVAVLIGSGSSGGKIR